LIKKVYAQLITPYNDISAFILRRVVERAFQLEESPFDFTRDSASPFIILAVDDIMYVVSS
jgi:hypothetical protein